MGVDDFVADFAGLFDELYAAVDEGKSLDATFIQKLNETNAVLIQRWQEIAKMRLEAAGLAPARRLPVVDNQHGDEPS